MLRIVLACHQILIIDKLINESELNRQYIWIRVQLKMLLFSERTYVDYVENSFRMLRYQILNDLLIDESDFSTFVLNSISAALHCSVVSSSGVLPVVSCTLIQNKKSYKYIYTNKRIGQMWLLNHDLHWMNCSPQHLQKYLYAFWMGTSITCCRWEFKFKIDLIN